MIPGLEYDPSTECYTMNLEESDFESASTAVPAAIAAIKDTEVEALDPINEVIDLDALDELFPPQREDQDSLGFVRFVYEDHQVTVYADQTIEFCPLNDA